MNEHLIEVESDPHRSLVVPQQSLHSCV